MTGTDHVLFTHKQSRSYLNHLVLKLTLERRNGGMDRIDLAQVAGSCECGNEPLGFINCEEILG